jgi:hypothetical protein
MNINFLLELSRFAEEASHLELVQAVCVLLRPKSIEVKDTALVVDVGQLVIGAFNDVLHSEDT